MPRYKDILDGANLADVATGESHSVDAGTFNYYGYTRPGGGYIILREKDDESEYRWTLDNTDYAAGFADRANKTYVTPDQINLS